MIGKDCGSGPFVGRCVGRAREGESRRVALMLCLADVPHVISIFPLPWDQFETPVIPRFYPTPRVEGQWDLT